MASSQGMVKVNILDMYDSIPSPPSEVREAYSRAECAVNGETYFCDSKTFFNGIREKLTALGNQIEKASAYLSMPTANAMANVEPTEMTKQIGLGPKTLAPEPGAVKDAVSEYHNVNNLLVADMQNALEISKKKNRLLEERNRKHKEIDVWRDAEIAKLPLIDYEVDKVHDPKAVYPIRVKAMEKHLAVENDYLQAYQKQWQEYRSAAKARYTDFQEKLAAINYGEDAKNSETKRTLLSGQGFMIGPIDELVTFSQNATNEAVGWWVQKLKLEHEKP